MTWRKSRRGRRSKVRLKKLSDCEIFICGNSPWMSAGNRKRREARWRLIRWEQHLQIESIRCCFEIHSSVFHQDYLTNRELMKATEAQRQEEEEERRRQHAKHKEKVMKMRKEKQEEIFRCCKLHANTVYMCLVCVNARVLSSARKDSFSGAFLYIYKGILSKRIKHSMPAINDKLFQPKPISTLHNWSNILAF